MILLNNYIDHKWSYLIKRDKFIFQRQKQVNFFKSEYGIVIYVFKDFL